MVEKGVKDYVRIAFDNIIEKKSNDKRFSDICTRIKDYLIDYDNKKDIDILMSYHDFFAEVKQIDGNISGAYRYLYDLDSIFLFEKLKECKIKRGDKGKARHADIMVSLNNIGKYIKRDDINEKYSKWIKNYCLSGNLLIMPSYLQEGRKQTLNQIKGCQLFDDKIDLFLYGVLSNEKNIANEYFGGVSNSKEWIKSEHLDCMFENFIVEKENLKWLGGKATEKKKYNQMTECELNEFLRNLLVVIEYRNQFGDEVERVNKLYTIK